jgi:hypothetical protein
MPIMRIAMRLAAVGVALALTACASSGAPNPQPSPRPVARDQRLVGTWRVTVARGGGQQTHVDPTRPASLEFSADGRLKIYDGGGSYHCTWAASHGRLVLTFPNGNEARLVEYGSPDTARVAMAINAVESSRQIGYAVSSGVLTLTGRSRLREQRIPALDAGLLAPNIVHIRYEKVN